MNKPLLLALLGIFAICRISFGASDKSSPEQITYKCFVIESDKPIPHDFSKLSQRKGIDVMSAPSVTGIVDQQLCLNIGKALIPEFVRGKKSSERIETGVSISLKGTLDHGDILLTGKTQFVDVADRRATPDSTCLATVTKTIYFSKIVKHGEDAWFDVEYPNQKSKYLTLGVIPTLLSPKTR
jgi:hypothetical protein